MYNYNPGQMGNQNQGQMGLEFSWNSIVDAVKRDVTKQIITSPEAQQIAKEEGQAAAASTIGETLIKHWWVTAAVAGLAVFGIVSVLKK